MARGLLTRFGVAAALAALVVASAVLRFAASRGVATPWIAPDEMLYALLGRGLYASGRLDVLGQPTPFYSLVYPALAGLPLSLRNLGRGYELLKALQAVVMSLTAVPVYLWGRTAMRRGWALAAAALTVAIPGLAYSGLVMTEVAFYPVVVLAAWATARALERPTRLRQAVTLAAVALAAATRLQALVLVVAVPSAAVVEALLAGRLRKVTVHWPLALPLGLLAALVAARGAAGLGGYAAVAQTGYSPVDALRFVLYHAAALLLLCGVVPGVALVLLLLRGRRGEPSAAARSLIAVASAFSTWTVLEVGVFASQHAHRIEERDLLALAPLLFLALALWLDRGAPRSYMSAATVSLVAAAIILALPYGRLVGIDGVQDSMTFAATLELLAAHPGLEALVLIGIPAAVLATLTALLPRRLAPALPVVLLLAFVGASAAASAEVRSISTERQSLLLGSNPRWIDAATRGPVAYVFGGGAYFTAVWSSAFWNRSVRAVYTTPGSEVLGPMPQHVLQIGGDGVFRVAGRPIRERYVVLPSSLQPAGTEIASTQLVGSDVAALGLWRLDGTPRLVLAIAGVLPNGDVYQRATLDAFGCAGGSFFVTLLGKTTEHVAIELNGHEVERVPLEGGEARTVTIPVSAAEARHGCSLALVPTSTLGTTVLRFDR